MAATRKVLWLVLAAIAGPGLLLVGLLTWLGQTDTGTQRVALELSRWLEPLEIRLAGGNLAEGLRLEKLIWTDKAFQLTVSDANLRWRPVCLLRSELCVDKLTAGEVVIDLPASTSVGPVALVPVVFPLPLRINQLELTTLRINRPDRELLRLSATGQDLVARGSRIQIAGITVGHGGNRYVGDGEITLRGEYPLTLNAELAFGDQAVPVPVGVDGSIAALGFSVHQSPSVPLSAMGTIALLQPDWPLQVEFSSSASALGLVQGALGGDINHLLFSASVESGEQVQIDAKLRCDSHWAWGEEVQHVRCEQLTLSQLETESVPTDWQLVQATVAEINLAQRRLTLPSACLEAVDDASVRLCLQDDIVIDERGPGPGSVSFENIPSVLPAPFESTLSGELEWHASLSAARELQWQLASGLLAGLQGRIALGEPVAEISVEVEELDVARLGPLLPDVANLQGQATGEINVRMEGERPWVEGGLQLSGLAAEISEAGVGVEAGTLSANFEGHRAELAGTIVITEFSPAELGLNGTVDWSQGPWSAEFDIQTQEWPVAPVPGAELVLTSDLHFSASPEATTLQGVIDIPTGRIDLSEWHVGSDAVLVSPDVEIVGQESAAASGSSTLSVNIALNLGDDVQFSGFGLYSKLRGGVELVKAPEGVLSARGSIAMVDGQFTAYGQNLKVESGRLEFSGPLDNPYLRLRAHRARSMDGDEVGIIADGPVQEPRIRTYSSVPMSEEARMHFLLTGQQLDQGEEGSEQAMAQAAMTVGLGSANNYVSEWGEKVGIQGFAVGTEMGEQGQQAQVSGYFGPDLYLKYGYGLFEPGTIFSARYRLRPQLYLEGFQGQQSALNLLWYFRRRQDD